MAEVFSSHFKGQRRVAFTLAEVLITLGIIGVVAAITMPTLIQNYKKTVYVNQLKKSVSMLEQGFQKMLADASVEQLTDIPGFPYSGSISTIQPLLSPVFKYDVVNLKKNERIYHTLNGKNHFSSGGYKLKFSNGLLIDSFLLYSYCDDISNSIKRSNSDGKLYRRVGSLTIDVNGTKGPNIWGRDVFFFVLGNDGKLFPSHDKDSAIYQDGMGGSYYVKDLEYLNWYWKNDRKFCGAPGESASESSGEGCAARIIENGWVMDY